MTRHTSSAAEMQHKRIDKLFGGRTAPTEVQLWEKTVNANCDIHGRRGSGGSIRSLSQRRDSTASSLYGGGGGSSGLGVGAKEPISKRDSIGSTILLNNTGTHWKNAFKRDSTPNTSASLHNLASDLRSSMARIESLDNPAADRYYRGNTSSSNSRATTPARTTTMKSGTPLGGGGSRDNSSSSFSNGIRRTSMPVLNQR